MVGLSRVVLGDKDQCRIRNVNCKNTDHGSQGATSLDGWTLPSTKRQSDAAICDALQGFLLEEHYLSPAV